MLNSSKDGTPPPPHREIHFKGRQESVSAGSVLAITGAILSYSSALRRALSKSLDSIAFMFKEAALARLKDVAVSFDSGASRSTLAVALAVCFSTFRMK